MSHYVSRFNPHDMSDDTVLAVATGRENLLRDILSDLESNLHGNGACQHLLVWGARGMGKSFFLKYLSIHFAQLKVFQHCDFVLFPEEQSNLITAADLVRMLLANLRGEGYEQLAAFWSPPENLWQQTLTELEQLIAAKRSTHSDYLLVLVVENINELLDRFDDLEEGRLRHLLEHLPGFTLLGASPRSDVDSDYDKRLFQVFSKYRLQPWDEQEHFRYFDTRVRLAQQRSGKALSPEFIQIARAKLRAISRFSGGSPRIAVVLTDLLLLENALISTAGTLYGLVDDLTAYYQDLVKGIPQKSRILFDALIRLGENLSQSELAERIGARQNEISRAFGWLLENAYVAGKKMTGSREFRYSVTDRVFVLYYLRREVYHGKNYTPVWLLADFLLAFYQTEELAQHAFRALEREQGRDAYDLARVALRAKGYLAEELIGMKDEEVKTLLINNQNTDEITPTVVPEILPPLNELFELETEEEVLKSIETLLKDFINDAGNSEEVIEKWDQLEELGFKFENKGFNKTSLSIFQKSETFWDKINYIEDKAWSLGRIGWNLQNLACYDKSIEAHKTALTLWKQESNLCEQAWNLSQIGSNLNLLGKHEESIEAYKAAIILNEKERDRRKQSWNLGQIGWNLKKLGHYEEAIESHQKALILYDEEASIKHISLPRVKWPSHKLRRLKENIKDTHVSILEDTTSEYAWNLNQIGWNLFNLADYEKAIDSHQKALILWEKLGMVSEQIRSSSQIGQNLQKLGSYEAAIVAYQKVIELCNSKDKINELAWTFDQIGWSLQKLARHSEAIETYQRAFDLWKQIGNLDAQALNMGLMSWNQRELFEFKKSNQFIEQGIILCQEGNLPHRLAEFVGQFGANLFLDNSSAEAWQKLLSLESHRETAFKQWGDGIYYCEKWQGQAPAFALGKSILLGLREHAEQLDVGQCLNKLFAGLIEMKISNPLLRDLADEAMRIFSEPELRIIPEAALHCAEFLAGGKNPAYLEHLHPDMAITVAAIAKEIVV